MTIQDIFTTLENQCSESQNIITAVNTTAYLANTQQRTIRDLVVKQAFINVFTEWEHFLENSTIAYSLGEPSIIGNTPVKYVSPLDEEHADRLIKGTATYPDWTDMEKVLKIEKAFFQLGEPYTSALNGFSSKYKDIKKVRNFIVHNSKKSNDEFDSLVRTALRASAVGISPVDFLLSKKGSNPYFYELYITHIKNAAKMIAEY